MTEQAERLTRRRVAVDLLAVGIGLGGLAAYALADVETAPVVAAYGLLWGTSTTVVTVALSRFTGTSVGAVSPKAAAGVGADGGGLGARAWGIVSGTAIQTADDVERDTGWLIGRLENVLVLTLVLLGEYTALSIIFAAKAWVRSEDTATGDTTYYLAGTLVNVTYSLVVGLATLWLLGSQF